MCDECGCGAAVFTTGGSVCSDERHYDCLHHHRHSNEGNRATTGDKRPRQNCQGTAAAAATTAVNVHEVAGEASPRQSNPTSDAAVVAVATEAGAQRSEQPPRARGAVDERSSSKVVHRCSRNRAMCFSIECILKKACRQKTGKQCIVKKRLTVSLQKAQIQAQVMFDNYRCLCTRRMRRSRANQELQCTTSARGDRQTAAVSEVGQEIRQRSTGNRNEGHRSQRQRSNGDRGDGGGGDGGQNVTPVQTKRFRTVFTMPQLTVLEAVFQKKQYMVGEERCHLAKCLGLSDTQIKVWFQNRRIKWRKEERENGLALLSNFSSAVQCLRF